MLSRYNRLEDGEATPSCGVSHINLSLNLSFADWVGFGGIVAGVVAGIMPVECDGLPRVVSRWSGLSGAREFFLQGRGGQEAGAVCLRSR